MFFFYPEGNYWKTASRDFISFYKRVSENLINQKQQHIVPTDIYYNLKRTPRRRNISGAI